MADNFLLFSEVVPNLTAEEEDWLKSQLGYVAVDGDTEIAVGDRDDDAAAKGAQWVGIRGLRDYEDYDPAWDDLGFQYAFDDDDRKSADWGRHLWIYAEDYGDVGRVAHLVRKFLKQFRPDQCWLLTFANTCSKPRVGEFGGGAVFVTADEIRWQNAYEFVEQQRAAFKQNGRPHQEETKHGQTTAIKP